MGLDFVSERELRTEFFIIPWKADDGAPQNQHENHFVLTYISTKLEIVSPLLVLIYFSFISCSSNFLFGKQKLVWDTLLSDLTLCVLCFIYLNLLTGNKGIIVLDQWSLCSRKLFQVVVSTRCFLRKHPHGQNIEYPQWMFQCTKCKEHYQVCIT